ncbi:MAG: hypothetical protein AAGI46_13035 [Planctomycetota bacterium]
MLAALVGVNAVLGLSLAVPFLPGATPANAQVAAGPSDYVMIPATLTSANQDILYIIDARTGNLTAAAFDRQNGITFIAPLPLSQAFNQARGR